MDSFPTAAARVPSKEAISFGGTGLTNVPQLLLTHGYFLFEDAKEREVMAPYPPLGLLYLSAYLKRCGFDVDLFDTTWSDRESLKYRLAADPGVLGIYANLITRSNVTWIAEQAHQRGWTVVVGGPEVANYPAEYLDAGADVVVIGEGEVTMQELLPALAMLGPQALHGIDGVVFRDEHGHTITNAEREKIKDIDSLPWPDREAIDMAAYVDAWRTHHGRGSVNLITSRGCPYKCNWCSTRCSDTPIAAAPPPTAPTKSATSSSVMDLNRSGMPTTFSPSATSGCSPMPRNSRSVACACHSRRSRTPTE